MEQNAFMILVGIKEGQEKALEATLNDMGNDVRGQRLDQRDHHTHLHFQDSQNTHFARFAILEDPDAGPGRKRLLFSSNYDGSLEDYLNELVEITPDEAVQTIWGRYEGFNGRRENLKAFLRDQNEKIKVDTFYVGMHGETVQDIHKYIETRLKFAENPDQSYWRTYNRSTARKYFYRLRGILAVLRNVPFFVANPGATIKALKALVKEGMPLNPVAPDYSSLTIQQCRGNKPPCLQDPAPATGVTELQKENYVGEDVIAQNQMNIISDIKPERLTELKVALKLVNALSSGLFPDGSLAGISTIHFARWVIIDDEKRLLFLSNYDGSWENYIGDFTDTAYTGLDAIWMNTQGFPGARDIESFKQHIRCRQVQSNYFYSAYRHETVQNIINDRQQGQ